MRVNAVECKGDTRKCIVCGAVKVWDYKNPCKCPTGKNHRWRHIELEDLTEEENKRLDKQIEEEDATYKPKYPQIIINNEEDLKKLEKKFVKSKLDGEKDGE